MKPRTVQRQQARWITPVALLALVCLLGPTLSACGSSEPVTADQVVGSWTSEYKPGRVDLELKADGTYLEHLYEFDTAYTLLPDRDHTGTWSIVGDQVVLAGVLLVGPLQSGEHIIQWAYVADGNWKLEVVRRLLGGVEVLKIEEVVRFKRVDSSPRKRASRRGS